MILALVLVIVGLVVVFSDLVTGWKILAEIVLGSGLIWSIKGITAANANNPRIISASAKLMRTVNTQRKLGWRLKND